MLNTINLNDLNFFFSWMEVWHRKKRQFLCSQEDPSPTPTNRFRDVEHYSTSKSTCLIGEEDLQKATCAEKKKPLADAFKNDIECGWGAAGRCQVHLVVITAILVVYHIII